MTFFENMNDLKRIIWALVLQNALLHNGKAKVGPVVGKLISIRSDLRGKIKEIIPEVENIVEQVNRLPLSEQEKLFKEYSHLIPERKREERKELPPLPEAEEGKVVTRFSPNPDFVLHLGSARAAILSHDYARMYNGKFILRFEDTDPRGKKPIPEYYDGIREDLKWLGCNWDEEYIQSLRLELYYKIARALIEAGKAYVCTCSPQKFKSLLLRGSPCPCRILSPNEHADRFQKMIDGEYKEGQAVLRIKTDLKHPDPSVRDWPALRIIDTKKYPHPITGSKYRVWPLYNFSCAVDDHFMEITHVIRGAEHRVNELRQSYIFKYMGWDLPVFLHHGKLGVEGMVLSKSKILAGIKSGVYSGVDDPRVATLKALRRRGFQPEAIRKIIHEVALNPSTAIIEWKTLEAYNRSLIDPMANRRMVVLDPILLKVRGLTKEIEVNLYLHPNFPEKGYRRYKIIPDNGFFEAFIDKNDIELIREKKSFRLMGLANITAEEISDKEIVGSIFSFDVKEAKKRNLPFIQWVLSKESVKVSILWSNGRYFPGLGERGLLEEKIGNIIQMERIGYAKIEEIGKDEVKLIYTHD